VSEVPLRAFWLQPFNRLLAEVTLRQLPTVVGNTFGSFKAEAFRSAASR